MTQQMQIKKFKNIDINDPFFDSLKEDYGKFEEWFRKKGEKTAYVIEKNGLDAFLYLKIEDEIIDDVTPKINMGKVLKLGTFKINPHGTRLGERFLKRAFDYGIKNNVNACYVTIFKKHESLVNILMKYGFEKYGVKDSEDGTELVLLKDFRTTKNDILLDYPLINRYDNKKYLLSVYPKYHTKMFPDSILNNESSNILDDVSYTNSIHKNYVGSMSDISKFKKDDLITIYRTKSGGVPAEYSAVITSICTIQDVKHQSDFKDFEEFYSYATTYSIFNKNDLHYWYKKGNCYIIKMTYNAILEKKLIRKKLIEEIGLKRDAYYGVLELTDEQFNSILEKGDVDEGFIID